MNVLMQEVYRSALYDDELSGIQSSHLSMLRISSLSLINGTLYAVRLTDVSSASPAVMFHAMIFLFSSRTSELAIPTFLVHNSSCSFSLLSLHLFLRLSLHSLLLCQCSVCRSVLVWRIATRNKINVFGATKGDKN